MGIKRIEYTYRAGDVRDVEEYPDWGYGAKGMPRQKRQKPTPEQMQKVNRQNKTKRCRQRLLTYFDESDIFATFTYEVKNRPTDMAGAKDDFTKAVKYIRKEYKKRDKPLYWIRNIEKGTRGAWHIHIVINDIGDTADILRKAWQKGGIYISAIRLNDKVYDEDFTKLASYMTKDERTACMKEDGTPAKPRIAKASYSTSRNMPLPEPKEKVLCSFPKEPKPWKGYYIAHIHEGINPLGRRYRHYTMIRIDRRPRDAVRRKPNKKPEKKEKEKKKC